MVFPQVPNNFPALFEKLQGVAGNTKTTHRKKQQRNSRKLIINRQKNNTQQKKNFTTIKY
jgi:hypothetical protein